MTKLPPASHWVVLRLLLEGLASSVAGAGARATLAVAFALLFAIMTVASAAAFFCASRASRVFFSKAFGGFH